MTDLSTTVAGVRLNGFAYNACGVNDEVLPQLLKISSSDSAAILLKSVSINPRKGNESPKYVVKSPLIPGGTLNSIGLSNKGLEQNLEYLKILKSETNKPVFVSLTNFSDEENLELLKSFQKQNLADLIELNVSCPNVGTKGLLGYYPKKLDDYLSKIDEVKTGIPLGLKLPPYLEEVHFDEVSEVILKHKIDFIVCCNTLGNALVIDPVKESVLIKPNYGRGGLGGSYLKPIALANVNSFYRRLKGKVDIVGAGGVLKGTDAFEYLLAGSCSVQVGTGFAQQGIGIFKKIHDELKKILESKSYKNLNQVIGSLKFID